jgi:hypothetical protein
VVGNYGEVKYLYPTCEFKSNHAAFPNPSQETPSPDLVSDLSCTIDSHLLDQDLAVDLFIDLDPRVHFRIDLAVDLLQLADVLLKNLLDLQRALLWVPRLVVLVVDVGDAEASLVSFGPFKVTNRQSALCSRNDDNQTYSIRLHAMYPRQSHPSSATASAMLVI